MATQFKHSYKEFGFNAIHKRVKDMIDMKRDVDTENAHVKFSYDNRKTGALVPSVSLIPIHDCGNCKLCCQGCYDIRNVCFQKTVQKSRANNSAIYEEFPLKYFTEIQQRVKYLRFFRWHVGGDIKDAGYFEEMVRIAQVTPTCDSLAFTKMFDIVNEWIDRNGDLPKNLHIIFSGWKGDTNENRHNLPVSSPVFPDGQKSCMVTEDTIWCEGDCSACAEAETGCWGAKKGQTILFEAH